MFFTSTVAGPNSHLSPFSSNFALSKDLDCDYAFLIALEKKKLQRMHDFFKRESCLERKDFVARDIAICIRLIDNPPRRAAQICPMV